MENMKTVIIDGVEMSYHDAHKKLWYWMAKTGKDKFEFFETFNCSIIPAHRCFACAFAGKVVGNDLGCKKCPITWGTEDVQDDCFCEEYNTSDIVPLYEEWRIKNLKDENTIEICKKIAELPWIEK